jgi:hypothetical protein
MPYLTIVATYPNACPAMSYRSKYVEPAARHTKADAAQDPAAAALSDCRLCLQADMRLALTERRYRKTL